MARLTIAQAADTLGIAQSTIRKRLRSGDLEGQKVKGAGGFRWEVFVAGESSDVTQDGNHANVTDDGNHGNGADGGALVDQMQARIDSLETQLTTRAGEIDQLHRLLAQTALNAGSGRPWWRFWR
jgi:hypothetical protein